MKVSDWRIGVRLAAGFAVLLVLLVAVGIMAVLSLSKAQDMSRRIVEEDHAAAVAGHVVINLLSENALAVERLLLSRTPGQSKDAIAALAAGEAELARQIQALGERADDERSATLAREIGRLRGEFDPSVRRVVEMEKDDRHDEAVAAFFNDTLVRLASYKKTINEFIQHREQRMIEGLEVIAEQSDALSRLLVVIIVAGIAVGGLIAWSITRSVTGPVRQLLDGIERAGQGDMTTSGYPQVMNRDEMGQLLAGLKESAIRVSRLVGQIRDGSRAIVDAAVQVATGSQELSSRTQQQAGALEETASAMEQLASTIQHTTANTEEGLRMTNEGSSIARETGDMMQAATRQMQGISQSSEKIAEIIGVIESIAFQTNILALNAAVEAARAGEQGKGFAVVASEVRSLAQRSAGAAKEIKSLIDDSVSQVQQGRQMVEKADALMQQMVRNASSINQLIADIAQASREQSDGVKQINQAIGQIDAATQQNAALVEQSASAALEMRSRAETLAALASAFKLDDSMAGTAVVPAAPIVLDREPAQAETPKPVRPAARLAAATPRLASREKSPLATAAAVHARDGKAEDDWTSF